MFLEKKIKGHYRFKMIFSKYSQYFKIDINMGFSKQKYNVIEASIMKTVSVYNPIFVTFRPIN